ncbi:RtcB family protein [Neorhizobium sp. P12A]|uniref:RtcB family protein n=1 Tax=Rhizobium/Agrobacterium group TaxID=227290 RepID=UPI00104B9B8E|nr:MULTISPECIES: RtcB family protein [Rhizobium/Agrobacterium group]KAA0690596.1 RtcB family protein [Neorhizobium sp. P12A]TCR81437.1 RNA-splicing ligase RtcB [Rhizobium sp. BK376]
MIEVVSGQDLINAGMPQGKWFRPALDAANQVLSEGGSMDAALAAARAFQPGPTLALRTESDIDIYSNIRAENAFEQDNVEKVNATMRELVRTPVVRAAAIMPDACPAGPVGTIPVGGVVASEAIHPGMHSADICCSMAISVFPGVDPKALLDAVHAVTHFGPGGRPRGAQIKPSEAVLSAFQQNPFLRDGALSAGIEHFGTQGDGNHFAYVGTMKSTGETALVTHHGSRAPGARLYDKGMKAANRVREQLSPETHRDNAWIPADTEEGDLYWTALQAVRQWTKENHAIIHDMAAEKLSAKIADRFWNEHNFVFRKSDGLFYHGKGATPAFDAWAEDATDLTIIPLNMAEPILIVRGSNAAHGLGFSPHGAGRNFSRSAHMRRLAEEYGADARGLSPNNIADILAKETTGLDVRFFSGFPDISELPGAYKSATNVRAQIAHYGLAEVVDEVLPYGSIMAGDWQKNAPWRKKRR